jgi:basic membrane protein A
MKKVVRHWVSGFGALAVLAAACTPPATPAPTEVPAEPTVAPAEPTTAPSDDALRVGLVTDVGEVDDRSFNQSAWEGAQAGAAAIGGQAQYIETQDAVDYARNIQQFVNEGYDVIITVGFGLGPATVEAAKAHPEILFIGVDQFQGEAVPNLAGLIFPEDQAGFLAGQLAASMSESGTIAAVLGTDLVPPVVAFGEGYRLGAQSVNPDISVLITYHPGGLESGFTDPEWGATTARQALDQGADVIFGAGGNTGNGALIEIATAAGSSETPLYCIGVDADQWGTLPEAQPCLITSAMKLITPGVQALIERAAGGDFPGGNFVGEVGLAPYHDFDGAVPAEVKTLITTTAAALKEGSMTTGYAP